MTIAVAIKTGAAVVFAADSKVTIAGRVGFREDGEPNWVSQTYDNSYKLAYDRERRVMAMVAGHPNIGAIPVADFISAWNSPAANSAEQLESNLDDLLARMESESRAVWSKTKIEESKWPGPSIIFASALPGGRQARVWHATVQGGTFSKEEILLQPGIYLEGSYAEVFTLLYGIDFRNGPDIAASLGVDHDKFIQAWRQSKTLSAIDKIKLAAMPAQDAMELAAFLANLQVQMDRFLPGEPASGGPIDLMVLQLFPQPTIVEFPGKTLHHPGQPT